MKIAAEYLRNPETVCQPDPRHIDPGTPLAVAPHGSKPFVEHHQRIASVALHAGVPEDITIQFETAKNIYLYAWYVYRFYPVAQSQAYVCLEFALRERLEQEMLDSGWNERPHGFGLRNYLKYAASKDYICNEDFEAWRHRVELRARQRRIFETIEEMGRLGLTECRLMKRILR